MLVSARSSQASHGVTLPTPGPKERWRRREMRPLTVRGLCSSAPLVLEAFTGRGVPRRGASRWPGFEAELDGGLEGGLSEVREAVADLLLRGVEDRTGRRLVDRVGDGVTELLEAAEQLLEELAGRQRGLGVPELLRSGATRGSVPGRNRFHRRAFQIEEGIPESSAAPRASRGDLLHPLPLADIISLELPCAVA
jgi:hypothetical protein